MRAISGLPTHWSGRPTRWVVQCKASLVPVLTTPLRSDQPEHASQQTERADVSEGSAMDASDRGSSRELDRTVHSPRRRPSIRSPFGQSTLAWPRGTRGALCEMRW